MLSHTSALKRCQHVFLVVCAALNSVSVLMTNAATKTEAKNVV